MKKISIVIPVFNEEATIEQILQKLDDLDLELEKEIVIVDDGSTDNTHQALQKYINKHKVIFHEKNRGKGRALRTGFGEISGDIVVVQDADLEYNPEDFKKMIAKMKEPGVAVVYGSRRLHQDYFHARKSGHIFAIGGIFLSWLTNLLYGTRITDEPTCYKMLRTDLLKKIDLECERFEFCPEITAKIAKMEIEIYEVPINYNPRHRAEGKKISFKDALEAALVLIKNRFK